MVEVTTKEFKRGIDKQGVLKNAEVFFNSPLGKKILSAGPNGSTVFQVCIRDNYFNIYWNGCSVLKYTPSVRENTYNKNSYLIHDRYVRGEQGLSAYLALEPRGEMALDDLTTCLSKDWSLLKDIVAPALRGEEILNPEDNVNKRGDGSLKEKALLKSYLESDKKPFLLDLEVAFSRMGQNKNGEPKPVADRVDMAEVIYDSNDIPVLKLVEVKASNDSRLRARDDINVLKESPEKIMYQMNLYQEFIRSEGTGIQESYRQVARNMLKLGFDAGMAGLGNRSATEVLSDFAKRGVIDPKPHLLVLASKEDLYVTDRHFQRLKEVIAAKYPPLQLIQVCKR